MPPVILADIGMASPPGSIQIVDGGDVASLPKLIAGISASLGGVVFLSAPIPSAGIDSGPVPSADLEFWLERQAFEMIPRDQLAKHEGMFVASKDGNIVDFDPKLEALTNRVFTRFGDVAVYMTRIGHDLELCVDTPFFE